MKPYKTTSSRSKYKGVILNIPFLKRILVGILILAVLSYFIDIVMVIFILLAIVFNAWLQNFQLRKNLPTDFELSTFATVLITISAGFKWGILVAIITKLIASVSTGNIIMDHIFMIMLYMHAAFWASVFSGASIVTLGIILTIINAFLMFFISKYLLGLGPIENLGYTGTNVIFNMIVFSIFGPLAKAILIS